MDMPLLSLHLRNQLGATLPQTLVPPASKQGHLLLVGHLFLIFTPLFCSMSPNKALPEFLWPLTNFY